MTPERACPEVLLVEDDYALREAIQELLEEEGHAVLTATDGDDGLARLAATRPCLVLLDLMMPNLDGEGFLTQGHARQLLEGVPVVVMTATPQRSLPHPVVAMLRKPLDLERLLDIVERYCSARLSRTG